MLAELHWEYLLILLVALAVVTAIVAVVVGAVGLVVLAARTRAKRERVGSSRRMIIDPRIGSRTWSVGSPTWRTGHEVDARPRLVPVVLKPRGQG